MYRMYTLINQIKIKYNYRQQEVAKKLTITCYFQITKT